MIKPDLQSATEIETSVIDAPKDIIVGKEAEALGMKDDVKVSSGSEVIDTNPLREEPPPDYNEVEPAPAYSEIEPPPPAYDETVITFTPVAVAKVLELLKEENDSKLGLRIFVAGGGCSGLQYGMTLDYWQDESDTEVLIKHEGGSFKTFIDDVSLSHVIGSEVDYVDSLMGAGFTVNNPNAVSSCGCGHSFKTADTDPGQARGCACGH